MSEENKDIVRRVYAEIVESGNMGVADDLLAPDYANRSPMPGEPPGREGEKERVGLTRAAFPDATLTIEDMIAEGDRVAVRRTFRGTHKGEFMGIAPTGKQVAISGISIFRIAEGKVVEGWVEPGYVGILHHLGAVPTQGQPG